ncbi:hypothetical protein AYI69_g10810 [Smittium culicis]|uniref:Uncharacterized protein n=1 Tax=Smittium culicis TaxID=133412 RepID=A0A1R1X3B4_9FUNG|nr:hypothetical protein AYI69_g10810 [Smittium culicis]
MVTTIFRSDLALPPKGENYLNVVKETTEKYLHFFCKKRKISFIESRKIAQDLIAKKRRGRVWCERLPLVFDNLGAEINFIFTVELLLGIFSWQKTFINNSESDSKDDIEIINCIKVEDKVRLIYMLHGLLCK